MRTAVVLWAVNVLPVALYLASGFYAYRIHRRVSPERRIWLWALSFVAIKVAIFGGLSFRLRSVFKLWQMDIAVAVETMDIGLLVASWCISLGIFGHLFLMDLLPIWRESAPRKV